MNSSMIQFIAVATVLLGSLVTQSNCLLCNDGNSGSLSAIVSKSCSTSCQTATNWLNGAVVISGYSCSLSTCVPLTTGTTSAGTVTTCCSTDNCNKGDAAFPISTSTTSPPSSSTSTQVSTSSLNSLSSLTCLEGARGSPTLKTVSCPNGQCMTMKSYTYGNVLLSTVYYCVGISSSQISSSLCGTTTGVTGVLNTGAIVYTCCSNLNNCNANDASFEKSFFSLNTLAFLYIILAGLTHL